ncbi:response regulator [Lewinella sp. 4G2]|uniref:response regulator n=1 Tax=Lewinella sp. 4G2 TaxID=1803372 RepID=UPI0007B4F59A|nr:response regulator [Lewinella sp. 4G2]OAV45984.1 hypothetical protein A3850_019000 [Lewinella sp. 4G2]
MPQQKVLLIDDSSDDAFLMERALRKVAPDVDFEWIEDAVKGFERLLDFPDNGQDVIFMDIKMPKMTGLEILDELQKRKKLANLRRVNILSSSVLNADITAALQYGNVAYYTKPAGTTDLRSLLQDVLSATTKDLQA